MAAPTIKESTSKSNGEDAIGMHRIYCSQDNKIETQLVSLQPVTLLFILLNNLLVNGSVW